MTYYCRPLVLVLASHYTYAVLRNMEIFAVYKRIKYCINVGIAKH